MWFLRREVSRHDVDRHLTDPRSLNGWALAGHCANRWAPLEDYELYGKPETVIADALNLSLPPAWSSTTPVPRQTNREPMTPPVGASQQPPICP